MSTTTNTAPAGSASKSLPSSTAFKTFATVFGDKAAGIILNAGAYSHSSIALLDALQAAELPVIEVHLSNIFRREPYRQHSYISLGAKGVICGLGAKGYELALEAMADMLAVTRRG